LIKRDARDLVPGDAWVWIVWAGTNHATYLAALGRARSV